MSISKPPESDIIDTARTVKVSNNSGEVTGFRVKDFQYSTIGRLVIHRLLTNRDMKILITSHGNTTGTGKTTLAIILCRIITKYANDIFDRDFKWDAESNSFIDVYEYLNQYKNSELGEVLLSDELEFLADRRRSMSHSNVHFSQAWQMLRYKNVVTIGTAPSMANLDKRIAENTDIWINVIFPGYANTYYMSMDDWSHQIKMKRLKQMGGVETIRWKPIDKDDDYKKLHEKKKDIGIPGLDETEDITKEDMEKAEKKTEKQLTKDYTVNLLKMKEKGRIDLTQEEIANLVSRSQQYVSKIKRENIE